MAEKIVYRMAELTNTDDTEGMVVSGRAIVYNSPTVIWEENGIQYKEIIAPGVLTGARMDDCVFRYNHDSSQPMLARYRGGSLALTDTDTGLDFRATMFDTQFARDCFQLVRAGALQCSFAFTVATESYDRATHTRTITRIKDLWDVSIVDIPAYSDTYVSARSRDEFDAHMHERLRRAREIYSKTLY